MNRKCQDTDSTTAELGTPRRGQKPLYLDFWKPSGEGGGRHPEDLRLKVGLEE